MINERYQVSAVPIGVGDRVTGYFTYTAFGAKGFLPSIVVFNGGQTSPHIIDPATIEPLKVRPKRERTAVGDYRCPNCNAAFIDGLGTTPYCGNCGQALEWEESSNA